MTCLIFLLLQFQHLYICMFFPLKKKRLHHLKHLSEVRDCYSCNLKGLCKTGNKKIWSKYETWTNLDEVQSKTESKIVGEYDFCKYFQSLRRLKRNDAEKLAKVFPQARSLSWIRLKKIETTQQHAQKRKIAMKYSKTEPEHFKTLSKRKKIKYPHPRTAALFKQVRCMEWHVEGGEGELT